MPNIDEFLKKPGKGSSKNGEWDLSSISNQSIAPTRPQRRPGRGDDSPNLSSDGALPLLQSSPLVTNKEPIGNQLVTEKVTNKEPIGNQLVTEKEATETRENLNWEPIGNPIGNQLVTQLVIKSTSPNKITLDELMRLPRNEERILSCILESCLARGQLSSAPLQLEFLAKATGTTKKTIKTACQRLIKKGIVLRVEGKRGKGGWTIFNVSETTRNSFLAMHRVNPISNQLVTQSVINKEPKKESNASSSSSFNNMDINTKTTTTEIAAQNEQLLPPDWERIDFSDLVLLEIHFGRPQLKQWYDRKYCTAQEAQESIYHFAFYLKHAKKGEIKTGPLNFFMGIMAKQKFFPRPDGYLSPEEEAQKNRILQQRKAVEQRQEREQEFFELVFEEYFMNLSAKKIRELSPMVTNQEGAKVCIRNLYFQQHWLEIREAFQQGSSVEQFLYESDEKPRTGISASITPEEARRIADQQFGSRSRENMVSS